MSKCCPEDFEPAETWRTYRYADPALAVGGEFEWTCTPEFFTEDPSSAEHPVDVVVEDWVLVARNVVLSSEVV